MEDVQNVRKMLIKTLPDIHAPFVRRGMHGICGSGRGSYCGQKAGMNVEFIPVFFHAQGRECA